MKISSVNLKNPINGLKNINMSQLGDIVVLTGANGAGKSRLLKLLEKAIMNNENRDKVEIIFELCNFSAIIFTVFLKIAPK